MNRKTYRELRDLRDRIWHAVALGEIDPEQAEIEDEDLSWEIEFLEWCDRQINLEHQLEEARVWGGVEWWG